MACLCLCLRECRSPLQRDIGIFVPAHHDRQAHDPRAAGAVAANRSRHAATFKLWCGDGRAIAGNDLRLEGEYFAAIGVHKYLQPLDVVVAIALVIAEGLDTQFSRRRPSESWKGRSMQKQCESPWT
jgi:hypothetical protein